MYYIYVGMITIPSTITHTILKDAMKADKAIFSLPRVGDLVKGTVIGKESGAVYLDLGEWGTGIIYGVEYFRAQEVLKNIQKGDTLSAKVTELENDEGYRELSIKEAGEEASWNALKEKRDSGELIEAEITDANRGGLMTKIEDIIGFLPVSQLTPDHYPRVEGGDKEKILEELQSFVGKKLRVRVIDVLPKENKLIVSERAAEDEGTKEALTKYKVGEVVEGEITGIVEFGAFIKFDALLEGLIHISELDWQLIENPRDVVKVGDKVKAKIVDISDAGRVSLSLKALKDDPWKDIEKNIKVGDTVEGSIKRINTYGALVELQEGIQGLLHVSEFDDIDAMKKELNVDDKKKFEVTSVDPKEHRIALKLKA